METFDVETFPREAETWKRFAGKQERGNLCRGKQERGNVSAGSRNVETFAVEVATAKRFGVPETFPRRGPVVALMGEAGGGWVRKRFRTRSLDVETFLVSGKVSMWPLLPWKAVPAHAGGGWVRKVSTGRRRKNVSTGLLMATRGNVSALSGAGAYTWKPFCDVETFHVSTKGSHVSPPEKHEKVPTCTLFVKRFPR